MSLKPKAIDPIPKETAEVARAAFPKGNIYMKMRDELGTFYEDAQFVNLFPLCGQPAESPWRLALVTLMQFAENLTDRQAADAVRGRIDWKYALGLELTDSGFNFSVLSEFRSRLIAGEAQHLLLEKMLTHFLAHGLLKARGRQRTDSTHVLAAIRTLNRLELVAETLIHTLNVLATIAPDWLKSQVPVEWFNRYEKRFDEYRLPKEKRERKILAERIGTDGHHLLEMLNSLPPPEGLWSTSVVQTMRTVWLQQFYIEEDIVHWRVKGNLPPSAIMISSPHDTDARYSTKRKMSWIGYKVHLTETCDSDTPHLITNVETTYAPDQDITVTSKIHSHLNAKQLLPKEHIADTAYGSASLIVSSQKEYDIDLLCPVRPDSSWQAQTQGAFDISQFSIDWHKCQVTCPMGKKSQYFTEGKKRERQLIMVQFDKNDCLVCPKRSLCTRSKAGARELTLSPQQEHLALQAARRRQQGEEFKGVYAQRAGVEGTISQAAYTLCLRRNRYRGMDKTHLQHVLTAAAINLRRVSDWFCEKPRSQTRKSRFAALAA